MNFLRLAAAAYLLVLPSGAIAGEDVKKPRAVVELFTSQGCTSCPKADAMLTEMVAQGDVVALAYHVDYWDYLGWRDTLANPDNTARQQEYSRTFGNRSVYTPQVVVNGRKQINGTKRLKINHAIDRMEGTAHGMTVDVDISYRDESIVIETGDAGKTVEDAQIVLIYFKPATKVEIAQGNNTGRSFTYVNAVAGFHSVGMWDGSATKLELPISEMAKKGAGGCAVLVQKMLPDGLPGPILGSAIITRQEGW
ncbi:DUF1223 domain-containing protein [Mesorhizobium sp. CAU 1741]|uniref:DUF1223 domain-containing protein n=1 Tax=Mesorhizobium sp. CAU 1741 TaxID=3140366 RepID=UPI00325AF8DD